MNTIRIGGDQLGAPPQLKRALTHLPHKLDREACLQVLAQIDPEVTGAIAAANTLVDVEALDSALEYTALSTDDKIRFKFALGQVGLMSRGRRI